MGSSWSDAYSSLNRVILPRNEEEEIMGYILGLLGMWIFSDAVYSYTLYINAPSYDGKRQNWKQDHWVRAVRAAASIAIMIIGGMLI